MDVAMDIVVMLTKDLGITVEDDYTNITRLEEKGVLSENDASLLRAYNGLRNAIVHRYDKFDLRSVKESLDRIDELYGVVLKLVEAYERLEG
ncbi:HepT-like ribonuclease domain-containing protein [Thermococcus sp.]|uniref:HepT-like ribonuclease domain-containing protein n=1 Tax=Thermococcus sp. TaxID=35749 RepID=UPI00260D5F16|nr:HepT-like ribonuclease domain-containing protein [Thermococcus sp.]